MSDVVVVALIGLPPSLMAGFGGLAAWRNAKAANAAVNNRPRDEPTISDDVKHIRTEVETIGVQLAEHLAAHERGYV